MADAKIQIQTLVDNKELQQLNKDFAEGSQKLKKLQSDLKTAEKQFGYTSDEAKKLRSELEMQRMVNKSLLKDMTRTTNELTKQGKAFNDVSIGAGKFGQFAKTFGVDLEGIIGKLSTTTGLIAGLATTVTVVGTALINAGRDMSALSNQFINFAGSAKEAEKMYSLFNDVYRNTNYDEQQVLDMGKSLMRIGVSAKEAAELIEKCADASAHMGKGAEFASQLADTLAKVKVGGELTNKQLIELAKSGIDLSDVQDQIKQGGEAAYEALKNKLGEFEGSMQKAKGTASEMEGDIKGNCIQIGRELAGLVDDIFNFSGMLRSFYQWVIDVSQTVINKIREMRNAFASYVASANAYAQAMENVVEPGEDATQEEIEAYRQKTQLAYEASEAAKAEALARAESQQALEKEAQTIRAITTGGAVSSGGSGGSSRSYSSGTSATTTSEAFTGFSYGEAGPFDSILSGLNSMKEIIAEGTITEGISTMNENFDRQCKYVNDCAEAFKNYQIQVGMKLGTTFAEIITGSKSAGEAMKDLAKNLIESAVQMLMQWAAVFAIVCAFSGPQAASKAATKAVFGIDKFAKGGFVSGAGSSTSDSIPAMLSDGEFVLNARAVEAIGVDNLNRANYGANNFNESSMGSMGGNITLNVSAIDASGFGDFLSRGGFDAIKQAFTNDDRMLGATAGTW